MGLRKETQFGKLIYHSLVGAYFPCYTEILDVQYHLLQLYCLDLANSTQPRDPTYQELLQCWLLIQGGKKQVDSSLSKNQALIRKLTKLILILRFSHISNHTLISNASLHHWLHR